MIAQSILEAASAMGKFRVPVVVRLQGTNSEDAQKMVGQYIRRRQHCTNQLYYSWKHRG